MSISNLKTAQERIADILATLVSAGTLGAYITDEGNLNLMTIDMPKDPCAVLLPPAIESVDFDTSSENRRVIRFEIPILRKGDNVTEKFSTAQLMTDIITAFDADPTLKGSAASGTVVDQAAPATVEHFTISAPDRTLIVFMLTLRYTVIGDWR